MFGLKSSVEQSNWPRWTSAYSKPDWFHGICQLRDAFPQKPQIESLTADFTDFTDNLLRTFAIFGVGPVFGVGPGIRETLRR